LCKYVEEVNGIFRQSLDGYNVDAVLKEFGYRYHKLIYDHLQQYTFSSNGAIMAICDVKNYIQSAQTLGNDFVNQLFESLYSLCNLLVVAPQNMREVCSKENYANLDRNILHSFVQLRSDYKSSKLSRIFS